jgi:hypothetical protein
VGNFSERDQPCARYLAASRRSAALIWPVSPARVRGRRGTSAAPGRSQTRNRDVASTYPLRRMFEDGPDDAVDRLDALLGG